MARKAVERNIAYDDQRKLYYVSMELGRDENGKRIKQYRTFPTLAAARNGLRDFHAGLERERKLERKLAPAQELDLSHWLEYWMDSIVRPNRAETTVYAYQKIIDNHIDPALGTVPLKRLTPKMVQEYYTETQRANGLSSNTMRRHHDLLSSALRSAVRQDVIPASPMERVEPPRVRTTESYFYNNQELKLLYQKIEGNILELAVKLAGSLGMRREEICGLKWEEPRLGAHPVPARRGVPPPGAGAGPAAAGALRPKPCLQPHRPRDPGRQGGALFPQRPVPGLYPVREEERPAPAHLSRPAAHLRHHRLLPGSLPVRHRQGAGARHPRHHRAHLHPSGGPDP